MTELDLDILLDNDCLLVINKPSGLPTQAPRQYDSVERRVREWLDANQPPALSVDRLPVRAPYLCLPHRIDRPASGVLLLAKTPRAARKISRQFERRQIAKAYWVCVEGVVQPQEGRWEDYVRKFPSVPKVEIVEADAPLALHAALKYRVVGQTQHGSWLEVDLQTGRTHQIRVQSAARGHPVIGDTLYGAQIQFGPQLTDERQRAIALHARSLMFRHPNTNETITVAADPPAAWDEWDFRANAK
jgi:23S rRNA pseudouridine1911/1915/1917 synthase